MNQYKRMFTEVDGINMENEKGAGRGIMRDVNFNISKEGDGKQMA